MEESRPRESLDLDEFIESAKKANVHLLKNLKLAIDNEILARENAELRSRLGE